MSLDHASMQRIAQASYKWLQEPISLRASTRTSAINLDTCPWLDDSEKPLELPYYLWDVRARRSVLTRDLN
jgi:hypothetical protein